MDIKLFLAALDDLESAIADITIPASKDNAVACARVYKQIAQMRITALKSVVKEDANAPADQ